MKKMVNRKAAKELLSDLSDEFVVIHNPSFIHPEYEVVPLAPKLFHSVPKIVAVVMDMDGTTTTTEELCIHSLEFMVRKITGRMNRKIWSGLDHQKDYPHIIGNSTTKHIEYLIRVNQKEIKINELKRAYIFATLWTLLVGKDESRREEVKNNLFSLGCSALLSDEKFLKLQKAENTGSQLFSSIKYFAIKYAQKLKIDSANNFVRAGIDIYYQRYHEILLEITKGNSQKLSLELLDDKNKHLIEPLAGIGIFLALIKGLLGAEADRLAELLIQHYYLKNPLANDKLQVIFVKKQLQRLGKYFSKYPLKVAVVTSSIFYEANIVLSEVFRILNDEIKQWNISNQRKKDILKKFDSYQSYYDTFVTASDSNEIRLKPHRDLYSIALNKLGIQNNDFNKVIGFEDSESGTISIRAAGIGRCVAMPFTKTEGHNFDAASYISKGGLPEIVLKKNIFLSL
jgi:beta-phosphoglucomutase-like phosphatase (HAD superfamily)